MTTKLEDLNPTTRCFPRSQRDAFKFDYMSGIEHYKRPTNDNYVVWILLSLAIIAISIAVKVMR
jgi:hypothetical protein